MKAGLNTPRTPWSGISIVLTDDDGITPVNREYFDKARPTDVISFAYDPLPGEVARSGEIFINAQRAFEVAPTAKRAPRELALYIAHGIDHLTGATDRTAAQRARMLRRENGWLDAASRKGLLRGLTG